MYQCYYENCEVPTIDILDPLDPDSYTRLMWSEEDSWTDLKPGFGSGDRTLPQDGANVMIHSREYMVL